VHPDDVQRVDRLILMQSPVALYHSPAVLREDVAALESYGYFCPSFDCAEWNTAADMPKALAAPLDFPDYHGENLDALSDCLADLDIDDAGGTAVVLWRFDDFWQRHERAWDVLDVIAHASWGHLLYGRRLLALVQSDDPTFLPASVGARPVAWNRREVLSRT
jgi:RNAse (barnase) inhibitor barstar